MDKRNQILVNKKKKKDNYKRINKKLKKNKQLTNQINRKREKLLRKK